MSAALVPELYCSRISRSLAFYTGVLGFEVVYERPEDRFAYLAREGAELMLEEPVGRVLGTLPRARPFGAGVNLQIRVSGVTALYEAAMLGGVIELPLEDHWYRKSKGFVGNRQFVVADPDGYLLRFYEDLGQRATPPPDS